LALAAKLALAERVATLPAGRSSLIAAVSRRLKGCAARCQAAPHVPARAVGKRVGHQPEVLSFESLAARFDAKRAVLFIGSAVSAMPVCDFGSNRPKQAFLPGPQEFLRYVFASVGVRLGTGLTYDSACQSVLLELTSAGAKRRTLLDNAKFENVLGLLGQVTSQPQVSDLIANVFRCGPTEFCANHRAVAELLQHHRLAMCLTTNFDNGVERAAEQTGGIPRAVLTYGRLSSVSVDEISKAALVKLHGDVGTRDFVLATEGLLQARRDQTFNFLPRLLAECIVLVAGYSGTGDVDVAPHLIAARDEGAQLVWIVRPGDEPPPIATHLVTSDLWTEDSSPGSGNVLLWLAKRHPSSRVAGGVAPAWRNAVDEWVESLSIQELHRATHVPFLGRAGWQLARLGQARRAAGIVEDRTPGGERFAEAYEALSVGAYQTSLRGLAAERQSSGWSAAGELWSGFCCWRLGYFARALEHLRYAEELVRGFPSEPYDLLGAGGLLDESAVRQLYLECVADLLGTTRCNSDRQRLAIEHDVIIRIQQCKVDASANDIRALQLLLPALQAEWHLHRKFDPPRSLLDLLNLSKALKQQGLASAAARLFAQAEPAEGRRELSELSKALWADRIGTTFLWNEWAKATSYVNWSPPTPFVRGSRMLLAAAQNRIQETRLASIRCLGSRPSA
jgi:SIR2-like domain